LATKGAAIQTTKQQKKKQENDSEVHKHARSCPRRVFAMVVQRAVDGGIFVFCRQLRRVEQCRKLILLFLRELFRRRIL
jgi:hypothetical protein